MRDDFCCIRKDFERIIAVGDIHGCSDLLKELVEDIIKFSPATDKLIFLGDAIDRGFRSRGVVLYLQTLKQKYPDNIILLKGNHEDMAYHFFTQTENATLNERLYARMWLENGGRETLHNFESTGEAKSLLTQFIVKLDIFHEIDTHLFVHGGIPKGESDIRKVSVDKLLWNRDWEYEGTKFLVVGHTPCTKVTKIGNVICCDTEAYSTGVLSGFDVINNHIYQTMGKPFHVEAFTERR
jgi:serine/threonine protein phosphatase 1